MMEHVADCLATRNPKYAEGVSPAILAGYDPPASRSNYLLMQYVFANLRLRERAELGRTAQQQNVATRIEQGYRGCWAN